MNRKKVSLWFKDHRSVSIKDGEYSDGSTRWHSEKYDYLYQLTNEEIESVGLTQENYRYHISQLHKTFKAEKNPKLVRNDVIPALKTYLKIVEMVSPRIDAKINKENDVLEMQNHFYKHARYYHGEQKTLNDMRFDIENLGEIKISSHGTITVKMEVTKEQLQEMIDNSISLDKSHGKNRKLKAVN